MAVAWVAGTCLYGTLEPEIRPAILAAAAALILCAGVWSGWTVRGSASLAVVLLLGASYFAWFDGVNTSRLPPEQTDYAGLVTISNPPAIDGDRLMFDARLEAAAQEKVRVFVRLESEQEQLAAGSLRRGDVLLLRGELRRPAPAGNFGGFDYADYLKRQHIHFQLQVRGLEASAERKGKSSASGITVLRLADSVRAELAARIHRIYPQPLHSGYMKGLLIGDRTELDPEQFRQFSAVGMTHVLAISGLHVGILIASLLGLLRLIRLTNETAILIVMLLIPFYVVLTGAAPSVVRAGLMALIGLYALRRGYMKDALHLAAAAAIAMLLWNPYYCWDVGFQLSFLTTCGLILLVPKVDLLLPIRNRWLRGAAAVALTAQLVSLPVTVYYFNQFHLLSGLINLVLVPVISTLVLPAGLAALLISYVSETLAGWVAVPIMQLNHFVNVCIEWTASMSELRIIWAKPPLWWVLAYYVVLWGLLQAFAAESEWRRILLSGSRIPNIARNIGPSCRVIGLACLAALLLLLIHGYNPERFDRTALVSFLDVGQGDSAFIRTPSGVTMLVDGGGTMQLGKPGQEWRQRRKPYEVGRSTLVPLLKQRGVRHIDYVVLSHLDHDHIGGLQAVFDEISVGAILFNGTVRRNENAEKLLRMALVKRIPLRAVRTGETLTLDGKATLSIIHPDADSGITEVAKQNNHSIVMLLRLYESNLLFTGDIEREAELGIVEQQMSKGLGRRVRTVDVMKVAHHGSKTSTTAEWLEAWRPRMSVISAGRSNLYGHPNPGVLERLHSFGSAVVRTDLHGEVQLRITTTGVSVRTKLGAANTHRE